MIVGKKFYFTLVELVIVIFLLVMIGTTMTIGTTKAIKVQKFRSASDKIESLLITAQNMAIIYQENITLVIALDPDEKFLKCHLDTESSFNSAIKKSIQLENISVSFNGKRPFSNQPLELIFRKDFSFPKGLLEISSTNSSQNKTLRLPVYLEESFALYPEEIQESRNS